MRKKKHQEQKLLKILGPKVADKIVTELLTHWQYGKKQFTIYKIDLHMQDMKETIQAMSLTCLGNS